MKIEGSQSLYDADLLTVVASPYGSTVSPTVTEAPIITEEASTTETEQQQEEQQQEEQQQDDCDSSYPDFCIPSPPPDRDCPDIRQKGFTVQGSDPHGFDRDNDGVGCD